MKKEAESRGAELVPSSLTLGIEAGSGVVSMRIAWVNLGQYVSSGFGCERIETLCAVSSQQDEQLGQLTYCCSGFGISTAYEVARTSWSKYRAY